MNEFLEKNADETISNAWKNYERTLENENRVLNKTALVLTGSTAAIALFSQRLPTELTSAAITLLVFAGIAILGQFAFAFLIWNSATVGEPGTTDVDKLWSEYVTVDRQKFTDQVLNDLCTATAQGRERVAQLATWFQWFLGGSFALLLFVIIATFIPAAARIHPEPVPSTVATSVAEPKVNDSLPPD